MDNLITIFNQQINSSSFSFLVLLISFLGGIVASISPCSLSILPLIIAYVGGSKEQGNKTTFVHMLFFVIGLSITMTIVGIICAFTGAVFTAFAPAYWILFLTGLIFIFGLNLLGIIEINYPVFIKELPKNNKNLGLLFPLILGMVFALASTPCSTPILAAIMTTASLSANYLYASLMLLLFALGQGVIIILAGVFTSFFKNLKSISKYSDLLVKISGLILILFALYLYYKIFAKFIY